MASNTKEDDDAESHRRDYRSFKTFGYRNFADPAGLVLRMLRSHDSSALTALALVALKTIATPIDFLLKPFETRRLKRAVPSDQPIILIVGLPRSGTTLVSQVLTNVLPVSYFDNFSALFPRSTITASNLLRLRHSRVSMKYCSFYGNTAGLRGINDAFHVWDRWLGDNRYLVPAQIPASMKNDMQSFFGAWSAAHRKPLINKNNRNADCIGLLAATLSNTFFVVVKRDPRYVAQSLLIARKQIQGNENIGWGLGSKNTKPGETATAAVVGQVLNSSFKLDNEIKLLPPERYVSIDYQDFCADPREVAKSVARRVEAIWPGSLSHSKRRIKDLPPRFTSGNLVKLPDKEFAYLSDLLIQLENSDVSKGQL